MFPAEIELLERCVTAFYQYSNEREETEKTVLKRNLKVGKEILSTKVGFCVCENLPVKVDMISRIW